MECCEFARLRMETHWGWVDAVGVIEMSPGMEIARGWGGCGVDLWRLLREKRRLGVLSGDSPADFPFRIPLDSSVESQQFRSHCRSTLGMSHGNRIVAMTSFSVGD